MYTKIQYTGDDMNQEQSGLRCRDAEACALGMLPCPTPEACGCALVQKPEALRLAALLDQHSYGKDYVPQAAVELRSQHARIAEMAAQLSAIGAGGVEALRKTAQEHAAQLAGQGQELDRQAALQDSAYAAGMLTGWNLCIADDHATFSKVRGERMTGAARVAKAAAAAPAQAQEDARDLGWLTKEGRIHGFRVVQTIVGAVVTHSTESLRAAIDAARAAQGAA